MAQYARPDSDVSAGGWTAQGQTNLYECVDEVAQNGDTDYILAESLTICELGLSSVTDPGVATGHLFRVWLKSSGGGAPERVVVRLFEGAVQRALSGNLYSRGVYAEWVDDLSESEADSITDYSNLSLKIETTALGGGETMRVTKAELEVPDAGGPTTGFNQLVYTSEPPTASAWNQVKREAGTGWRKILYV